jgi:hypothetical protein
MWINFVEMYAIYDAFLKFPLVINSLYLIILYFNLVLYYYIDFNYWLIDDNRTLNESHSKRKYYERKEILSLWFSNKNVVRSFNRVIVVIKNLINLFVLQYRKLHFGYKYKYYSQTGTLFYVAYTNLFFYSWTYHG